MSVSSIATTQSLAPAQLKRAAKLSPRLRPTITEPPFSAKAQKQVNAINTGRTPHRGHRVDIKV
jgi:hypothetical protein